MRVNRVDSNNYANKISHGGLFSNVFKNVGKKTVNKVALDKFELSDITIQQDPLTGNLITADLVKKLVRNKTAEDLNTFFNN